MLEEREVWVLEGELFPLFFFLFPLTSCSTSSTCWTFRTPPRSPLVIFRGGFLVLFDPFDDFKGPGPLLDLLNPPFSYRVSAFPSLTVYAHAPL